MLASARVSSCELRRRQSLTDLVARVGRVEGHIKVIVQAEVCNVLRQAVDVVVGNHGGDDFQKLVLKHNNGAIGGEENFSGASTGDLKLEAGRVCPCKGQIIGYTLCE